MRVLYMPRAAVRARPGCDDHHSRANAQELQLASTGSARGKQGLRSYGSQTIRSHTGGGQGGPNGAWMEKYKSTKRSNKEHCFRALVDEINTGFELSGVTERSPPC